MSSDTVVSGVKMTSCNDSCGCPSPCPGGILCRCMKVETTNGDGHAKCLCGEHCGCNPCTCAKGISSARPGSIYCNCAQNCNCPTCAS